VSTKPEGVTPSQTVGPYFAYGLTSQGQYDWNDAFSNNLVTVCSSTSEGDHVLKVVDSVSVLNRGQVLWQGSSAHVRDHPGKVSESLELA